MGDFDDVPSNQKERPNPEIANKSKKKKRGVNRETITLGGIKKLEKATLRKEKQKLNRKLGSLIIPTIRREEEERATPSNY